MQNGRESKKIQYKKNYKDEEEDFLSNIMRMKLKDKNNLS